MSPRRGQGRRALQRDAAQERERLERTFADRIRPDPDLRALVTARRARREPFHRWLDYRQGFAPDLVRRFLSEAEPVAGPVLDPFNGSGTVTTECGRRGRDAVGVDAVAALARLAGAAFLREAPPWPEAAAFADLEAAWARAEHPAHRAAVLLAAAGTVDGEGHPRRDTPPAGEAIAALLSWLREDLAAPLPGRALLVHGDARRLPLRDAACGGALTSPPYLSRYDYARVNDPAERLLTGRGRRRGRRPQVRAAPGLSRGAAVVHPAATEAAAALAAEGARRQAGMVAGYVADMARVLAELARTLREGAPLWIVVAGSEVKRTYVPTDLVLADLALPLGFDLEGIDEARRMRPTGRRLGGLPAVAPREVLLRLRRRSARP